MSGAAWGDRAESLERMAQNSASDDLKNNLLATQHEEEEECLDWDDGDDKAPASFVDSEAGVDKDDKSMCVALCTVALAIPALVGSWCWPILVGAMFAVAASNVNGGLVAFFHGVQVAVMMSLMTNILQFAWWKLKKKKGTHWQRKGPLWILLLASLMVLTQPVCMLVVGSWENMPNFFFDGGDTGKPCSANADCGSKACDPSPGIYNNNYLADQTDVDYMLNQFWIATGCNNANWNTSNPADSASMFATAAVTQPDGSIDTADNVATTFFNFCTNQNSPMHASCTGGLKTATCTDVSSTWPATQVDKAGGTNACQCKTFVDQPSCGCTCEMDSNALVPNTPIGLFIQIFCTYGGFILMFTGVFQATGLHKKIMAKWAQLRGSF